MTTLETRPRAPGLRPLSLGCTTGRTPDLKMATAPTPTSCDSAWSCLGHAGAERPTLPRNGAGQTAIRTLWPGPPGPGARLRRSLRAGAPPGARGFGDRLLLGLLPPAGCSAV